MRSAARHAPRAQGKHQAAMAAALAVGRKGAWAGLTGLPGRQNRLLVSVVQAARRAVPIPVASVVSLLASIPDRQASFLLAALTPAVVVAHHGSAMAGLRGMATEGMIQRILGPMEMLAQAVAGPAGMAVPGPILRLAATAGPVESLSTGCSGDDA